MTTGTRYLEPTRYIDSNAVAIRDLSQRLAQGTTNHAEAARALFYFARDEVRYNPYASLYPLEASSTLERGYGFCVQKAALLAAMARTIGIPARLGFVNIRNHRLDPQWTLIFRSDVVVCHGFTELQIDGKWIKATPAFDLRMRTENGFKPVEFDGTTPAMLHPKDQAGRPHIEYLEPLGSCEDVPVDMLKQAVTAAYGPEFLQCWTAGDWSYYAGL